MKLKDVSLNIALLGIEKGLDKQYSKIKKASIEFIDHIKKNVENKGLKIKLPKTELTEMPIVVGADSDYFNYFFTSIGIMGMLKTNKIEDETKLINQFDSEVKSIIDIVMKGLKEKYCGIRIGLDFEGEFQNFIDNFIKSKEFERKNIKAELSVIGIVIKQGRFKWQALVQPNKLNLMLSFTCEEKKQNKDEEGFKLDDLKIIEVIQDVKILVGRI